MRNRIAATSTFYGTIDGELYSQAIVDAIIANGNVLDPEVTASGDTGINLFTNGVTTETRGAELMFDYLSDFSSVDINWSISATYNKTEVTGVRATPVELGTQPLFDQEALRGPGDHGAPVRGESRGGVRLGSSHVQRA